MEESDVVVAGNQVAERRQTLVNALHDDFVGKRVADVLELHI